MWRRVDFKICGVVSFYSQFGNTFLVNGMPFFIIVYISCGFFKYAWCIFKATQVIVYIKLQMLKHITITLK